MEIREDNFSMKFNLSHLRETTEKIMKGCQDISSDYKDLHYKNYIDIRSVCQSIDIGFLIMVDMIENTKGRLEDHYRVTSDKVRGCVSGLERLIGMDQLLSGNGEGDGGEDMDDLLNLPEISEFEGVDNLIREKIIAIQGLDGSNSDKKAEGEAKYEILKVIEAEEITKFIKNNGKRSGSKGASAGGVENLIEKVVKTKGPWLERVEKVKSELEEFDTLKLESEKSVKKVEEIKKELTMKDQEVETMNKVKQTLEDRVTDLEIKTQNLGFVEKDRKRLMEKEKKLAEMCDTYREKIELLKKQLESSNTVAKSPKRQETIGDRDNSGNASLKLIMAKKMPFGYGRKGGSSSKKREEYSFKEKYEISGLMNMIGRMSEEYRDLLSVKFRETIEEWRFKMPNFCQNYMCLADENPHDAEFHSELKTDITKLNEIEGRLKQQMLGRRVVNLAEIKGKSSLTRAKEIEMALVNEKRSRDECRTNAEQLMQGVYKNYLDKNGLSSAGMNMERVTDQAVDSTVKRKIGVLKFMDVSASESGKVQGNPNANKVGIRREKLHLVSAIKLC